MKFWSIPGSHSVGLHITQKVIVENHKDSALISEEGIMGYGL